MLVTDCSLFQLLHYLVTVTDYQRTSADGWMLMDSLHIYAWQLHMRPFPFSMREWKSICKTSAWIGFSSRIQGRTVVCTFRRLFRCSINVAGEVAAMWRTRCIVMAYWVVPCKPLDLADMSLPHWSSVSIIAYVVLHVLCLLQFILHFVLELNVTLLFLSVSHGLLFVVISSRWTEREP